MGLWALMILLFVFDTGLATLPRLPCICFLVGFGGYCFFGDKVSGSPSELPTGYGVKDE